MPDYALRLLRRWLLIPACAALVGIVLLVGSIIGFRAIDSRLRSNRQHTSATVVWSHRDLFDRMVVRVSFATADGRTVLATIHTGSPQADGLVQGDSLEISYNTKHPSAVAVGIGDSDDTRQAIWTFVAFVATLTAAVAAIALAVRLRATRRYNRCFTGSNDAIPAQILAASPGKFGVTSVELEIPSEIGPWPLAVRLLRGQDAKTFTPGQNLGVRLCAERRGPVVLSSGRGERVLLGRGLGLVPGPAPLCVPGNGADVVGRAAIRSKRRLKVRDRERAGQAQAIQGWNEFSSLSAVRVKWRRVSWRRFQLAYEDGGDHLADVDLPFGRVRKVRTATTTYRTRQKLGVEGLRIRGVYDSTGAQTFAISGRHFNHTSGSTIRFPDGGFLGFPVYGSRAAVSAMAAVDGSGDSVMMFRSTRWKPSPSRASIEVAVHPDRPVTDDLLLVIAVASRFLIDYFKTGGGGG